MENLQQVVKTYTVDEYKNGIHQMGSTIKVKSENGLTIEIVKSYNNVHQDLYYIGSIDVVRKSKKSVINYLLKN